MELFLIYSDYLLTEHALTSTHCPPFILSRIGQTFLCQFSPTLTQSIAIVNAKHCLHLGVPSSPEIHYTPSSTTIYPR